MLLFLKHKADVDIRMLFAPPSDCGVPLGKAEFLNPLPSSAISLQPMEPVTITKHHFFNYII